MVGRLQPRHMQDVIADISLFRPGPARSPAACPNEWRHWPCPPPICRITSGLEALRARS
ncbi:hypothetical protein OHB25_03275 [Streptomyces mirabilis]